MKNKKVEFGLFAFSELVALVFMVLGAYLATAPSGHEAFALFILVGGVMHYFSMRNLAQNLDGSGLGRTFVQKEIASVE